MPRKGINHNNLRYHRRLWGYSLKEVAFLLGHVSTSQLIRWERGSELPGVRNLLLLAYIYRIPCECLFPDLRAIYIAEVHAREQVLKKRSLYD